MIHQFEDCRAYIFKDTNVYHPFPIFCEKRDWLQSNLMENGVQSLINYPIPPHLQECYHGEWENL